MPCKYPTDAHFHHNESQKKKRSRILAERNPSRPILHHENWLLFYVSRTSYLIMTCSLARGCRGTDASAYSVSEAPRAGPQSLYHTGPHAHFKQRRYLTTITICYGNSARRNKRSGSGQISADKTLKRSYWIYFGVCVDEKSKCEAVRAAKRCDFFLWSILRTREVLS